MTKGKKKKITGKDAVFNVLNYTSMLILMFVCIYPLYYVFIYSISDADMASKGLTFLPKGVTLENYKRVLALDGIPSALWVSVARTVVGAALTTICSAFVGYLFTKPMYFRKFFYRMLVITMYVNAGVIPYYMFMKTYGLLNTFWVYVIPTAVGAYDIILCKTFIENLPPSLEESARLDGAGYMTVFLKIVLPLSKAIVASIVVFSAVGQWNSWTDNYMYVNNEKLNTLQLILYNFLNESTRLAKMVEELGDYSMMERYNFTPMAVRMTITMLVVTPILCVYPFMQKYCVKGVMIGAVKG